jgi:copper(I)-binding protein
LNRFSQTKKRCFNIRKFIHMTKYLIAILLSLVSIVTASQTVKHGNLELSAMTFRVLKGGQNGCAYITIINTSKEDDRLISATCDKSVADHVELHDHLMNPETNVMRMIEIKAIDVKGDQTPVKLESGGKHLMLMKVTPEAADFKTISLDLEFEKAGKVTVTFDAEKKSPCCSENKTSCCGS